MACSERVAGWFLVGIFLSGVFSLVLAVAHENGPPAFNAPPSLLGIALTIVVFFGWLLIRSVAASFPMPTFYCRPQKPHELFTPLYEQR